MQYANSISNDDTWDLTVRIFANELGVDDTEPFYDDLVSLCNELLFTLPDERWKVCSYLSYNFNKITLYHEIKIIIKDDTNYNDFRLLIDI